MFSRDIVERIGKLKSSFGVWESQEAAPLVPNNSPNAISPFYQHLPLFCLVFLHFFVTVLRAPGHENNTGLRGIEKKMHTNKVFLSSVDHDDGTCDLLILK